MTKKLIKMFHSKLPYFKYGFYCYGCSHVHSVNVNTNYSDTFNNDWEKPTFKGELMFRNGYKGVNFCTLKVIDGMLIYGKCTHNFSEHIVEMEDMVDFDIKDMVG